jgi:flagellar motor switch protein FliN
MNEAPLSWVKEIQHTLIDTGAIPLSGHAPAFPWNALSSQISSLLDLPDLKITPHQTSFLKDNAITTGFGSGFVSIALDLAPLSNQVFWLMSRDDVAKLTSLALTLSQKEKGFSSPKFQEGFYYFLGTQAVQTVNALSCFGNLALNIAKPASPPQEESLCIDVEIQHPEHTFWGRLVCPTSFHEAFKTHFASREPPPLTEAATQHIDISLHVQLGQTSLSLSEWQGVNVGDFILLDRCTFDPKTHKGTAALVLEQTPIFRARIKDNSLKIVDYALYREEENSMNFKSPHNEENPEEDLSSVELEAEEADEGKHLWSPENDETTKLISPREIPLTLSIEVARLQMSLDKLLQLSPGNVLELPVKPEQGVDVVIGGKKVAKAELIKLGAVLGIKILQIGE